jgi:hypothetical protein
VTRLALDAELRRMTPETVCEWERRPERSVVDLVVEVTVGHGRRA